MSGDGTIITLTDKNESVSYKLNEDQLSTEAEKILLRAWKDANNKLKLADRNNSELKDKLDLLQSRLLALENKSKSENNDSENSRVLKDSDKSTPGKGNSTNKNDNEAGYCTDDDLLAKETEWVRAKSRYKKRKLNISLSPPMEEVSTHKKTDPTPQKIKKNPPLPPIIVDGIKSYKTFHEKLVKLLPKQEYKVKLLGEDSFKINLINDDDYRLLTKELNKDKYTWHSYENKQSRPIRVMAKKLHRSCDAESVIEDLKDKGFKILNASIKLKWKTKEPLDMFMLEFDAEEEIDKIYKITNIMGCKVEIEAIKKSKLIAQCKRCQAYGHTQKYCYKEFRCVKCAGKHNSKDCVKSADEKPKCIHCGESHPASYRGCSVAVELQRIRSKSIKPSTSTSKKLPEQSNMHNEPLTATSRGNGSKYVPVNKHVTYATATKGLSSTFRGDEQKEDGVLQILQVILGKLDRQETLLSSFEGRLQKLESSTILAGSRRIQ